MDRAPRRLDDRTPHWLMLLAAGLVPAIVYMVTLHRGLPAGDSGELITAAWTFGIAHPPGYPLYVLLAGAWAHVFAFGSVAWRMNLASALAIAAAAAVLAATVAQLSRSRTAGVIAAWTFAFATPVWKYALVAEVFPMNALLAAIALWLFVRALPERPVCVTAAVPGAKRARGALPVAGARLTAAQNRPAVLALAFVVVLALSLHHTLLLLGIPLALVAYVQGWRAAAGHRIAFTRDAGLAKSAALLPLLWLPFASHRVHALVWGDASSVRGFLSLLLRADYGTFHLAPQDAHLAADTNHVLLFAHALPAAFGLVPLLLAVAGAGVVAMRHRALSTALAGYAALQVLFFTRVEFPSSALWLRGVVERFYILPLLVLALLAGLGAAWVLAAVQRWRWVRIADTVLLLAIALVVPLFAHGRVVDQRGNHFTESLGRGMLASVPANTVLFVQGDLLHNSLAYLTRVEGQRPDITVLDQELMTYPWYVRRARITAPRVLPPLGTAQRIALADGRVLEGYALAFGESLAVLTESGQGMLARSQVVRVMPAHAESLYTTTRATFRDEPLLERSEDRYSGLPGTRNLLWLEHLAGGRPVAFVGLKDDSWALRYAITPVGLVGRTSPRTQPVPLAEQVRVSMQVLAGGVLEPWFHTYEPNAFELTERWRLTALASRAALLLSQNGVLPLPDSLESGHQQLVRFVLRFEALEPTPDAQCLRAIAFLREADPALRDPAAARRDFERYVASGDPSVAKDAEAQAALARLPR